MANSKISALTAATTPLAGTEVAPIVQSSSTKQVSIANLTAGRDTSFKTGTATPRNGAIPTSNSVLTGLTIFNDQDSATGDGVALVFDHSYRTPGSQTRGVKLNSYSTTTFAGYVGAKLYVTNNGNFYESVNFVDNGDVKITNGSVTQGTAAKGFDFSANTPAAGKTSTLLNWYEEGTFTPTIVGTTSAGTGTYSTQSGTYTRIGRVVTFSLVLVWTAHTGTGNIRVNGLPFTPSSVQYVVPAIAYNLALTAGNTLIARTVASTASIELLQSPTGGGAWNPVPMDTNVDALLVSGSYTV